MHIQRKMAHLRLLGLNADSDGEYVKVKLEGQTGVRLQGLFNYFWDFVPPISPPSEHGMALDGGGEVEMEQHQISIFKSLPVWKRVED